MMTNKTFRVDYAVVERISAIAAEDKCSQGQVIEKAMSLYVAQRDMFQTSNESTTDDDGVEIQ